MPSTTDFDVFIVGAGPAGSSLAIRLSKLGLRVGLAEQKAFPRHKLCGEFVSPENLAHFEELGIDPPYGRGASKLYKTVFYSLSGRSVTIRNGTFSESSEHAVGLSRAIMDEMLLARARDLGVVIFEGSSATGLIKNGADVCGLEIRNAGGERLVIKSALTVDASGRARVLVRKAIVLPSEKPTLIAFKTHLADGTPGSEVCEIYSYPGGYGGLNSIGEVQNLCFVVTAKMVREFGNKADALLREIVMKNPRAAETLGNARAVESWIAVAIDRFGTVDPAPAKGLIAIGDAASFIDPFTGSGILMAFESSRVAADTISLNIKDPERLAAKYQTAYRRKFSRRLRVANLLRSASGSTLLAEIAVASLASSRRLRTLIARSTRS